MSAHPEPVEGCGLSALSAVDQRFVGAAVGQLLATEPDIEVHCCHQAADAIAMANQIRTNLEP